MTKRLDNLHDHFQREYQLIEEGRIAQRKAEARLYFQDEFKDYPFGRYCTS